MGGILYFLFHFFGLPVAAIVGIVLLLLLKPQVIARFIVKVVGLVALLALAVAIFAFYTNHDRIMTNIYPDWHSSEINQLFEQEGFVPPVPLLNTPQAGIRYFGKAYTYKFYPKYEGDGNAYYVYYTDENLIILGFSFLKRYPSEARSEFSHGCIPYQPGDVYPYPFSTTIVENEWEP